MNGLLWKIESDTLPGASFVFGTMHVRDGRAFQRLEQVYEATGQCEAFAAELDLGATSLPAADPLVLPKGVTLDQLISIKKYKKISLLLQKTIQIDINLFNHYKPIVLSQVIDQALLITNMPCSLDEYLWQYAQTHNKSRHGIETLQEQVNVLQKISIEQQIKNLLSTLRNFPRYRQQLLRTAHWYEQGDVRKLYQATKQGTHEMRRFLLYERNRLMAERIAHLMQVQTTFCAIGAAHLAGQKGVLRLLKQKGYMLKMMDVKEIK